MSETQILDEIEEILREFMKKMYSEEHTDEYVHNFAIFYMGQIMGVIAKHGRINR